MPEILTRPIFATNVSRDSFDFANILYRVSGYPIQLTSGAVDNQGSSLRDCLRVMVDSQETVQRVLLLYQHGHQFSTVTAVIDAVSNGRPDVILPLLHGQEDSFYSMAVAEERKSVDFETIERTFLKSFRRVAVGVRKLGFSDWTMTELEACKEAALRLGAQGQQPINLSGIRSLMRGEIPAIKQKVEQTVQFWKDFGVDSTKTSIDK